MDVERSQLGIGFSLKLYSNSTLKVAEGVDLDPDSCGPAAVTGSTSLMPDELKYRPLVATSGQHSTLHPQRQQKQPVKYFIDYYYPKMR